MVRGTGKLAKQLKARAKLLAAKEKLDHDAIVKPEKKVRVMELPKGLPKDVKDSFKAPPGFKMVSVGEAAEMKQAEIDKNYEAIRAEYELRMSPDNNLGCNYFVLFKKHRACNLAKQCVNTRENDMEVHAAPLNGDVRWQSLTPAAEKAKLPVRASARLLLRDALLLHRADHLRLRPPRAHRAAEDLPLPQKPFLESLGEGVKGALTAFLPMRSRSSSSSPSCRCSATPSPAP